jgi:hypothetical protein
VIRVRDALDASKTSVLGNRQPLPHRPQKPQQAILSTSVKTETALLRSTAAAKRKKAVMQCLWSRHTAGAANRSQEGGATGLPHPLLGTSNTRPLPAALRWTAPPRRHAFFTELCDGLTGSTVLLAEHSLTTPLLDWWDFCSYGTFVLVSFPVRRANTMTTRSGSFVTSVTGFESLAQRMRVSLLVCCCVLAFGASAASAQTLMSAGIFQSGETIAIAMTCPSGYKLGQIIAQMQTTDGSQFTHSSGSSLPLPVAGSATSAYTSIMTPTGSMYYSFTCQSNANGYCAIQFSVGFYCKPQTGQRGYQLQRSVAALCSSWFLTPKSYMPWCCHCDECCLRL